MRQTLRVLTLVPLVWSLIGALAVAQSTAKVQLPTQQQLSRLGLERVWWAQAVINTQRDKIEHVSIDEEVVYVQTTSGITTAFDTETGRQKWALRLGRYDQPSFAAISNEEEALIVVGSTMFGIEKNTGRLLWQLILDGQPSTGPTVDANQVYFGTLDGSVYAYNLKKIRKMWAERRLPGGEWEAQVWKYKAGKEITSPPIVAGRSVNFASRNGSLYSISSMDRKLIYQIETDKPLVTPLARLDNMMYVASEDNSFLALNLLNGQVEFEFTSGMPIRTPIWAINRDLFVFPERSGVISLDPKNGNRKWNNPTLKNFVAMIDGAIATLDYNGNLVVVTLEKGQTVGTLPVRQYSRPVGNDRTDRIFLATESGLVVCIRQIGHTYPVYYRFPDRLPLLPEFEPEEDQQPEMTPESTSEPESTTEDAKPEEAMSDESKPEVADDTPADEPKTEEATTEEAKPEEEMKEEPKADDSDPGFSDPNSSDSGFGDPKSDDDSGFSDSNPPEKEEK